MKKKVKKSAPAKIKNMHGWQGDRSAHTKNGKRTRRAIQRYTVQGSRSVKIYLAI